MSFAKKSASDALNVFTDFRERLAASSRPKMELLANALAVSGQISRATRDLRQAWDTI